MSSNRQLASIMFTDDVGYTALKGKDDDNVFAVLSKNQEIRSALISHHNGTLIKEMGDVVSKSLFL